jgi:hypothetical protein
MLKERTDVSKGSFASKGTGSDEEALVVDGGQFVSSRWRDDQSAMQRGRRGLAAAK